MGLQGRQLVPYNQGYYKGMVKHLIVLQMRVSPGHGEPSCLFFGVCGY